MKILKRLNNTKLIFFLFCVLFCSTVYSTDGQLRALDCLPEWLGTIVNCELFYERFNFIYLQNYRGKTEHIASQHASFM